METTVATRKRQRAPIVHKPKPKPVAKKAKHKPLVIDLIDSDDDDDEKAAAAVATATPTNIECAICLCECVMPMRYILCGHQFCLTCYQEWRAEQRSHDRSCPICRGEDDDALDLPRITVHYCHETRENCEGELTVSPHDTVSLVRERICRAIKHKGHPSRLSLLCQGKALVADRLLIDTKVQHSDMLLLREPK
jgi:hypothetical protein